MFVVGSWWKWVLGFGRTGFLICFCNKIFVCCWELVEPGCLEKKLGRWKGAESPVSESERLIWSLRKRWKRRRWKRRRRRREKRKMSRRKKVKKGEE